jgi:hypothetical protein
VKFTIEIGENERNRLEYSFNQLLGSLVIKVNEKPVRESRRLFNEPILEVDLLVVGRRETALVRIEKERTSLLGHRNRLYINDRLFKVFEQ